MAETIALCAVRKSFPSVRVTRAMFSVTNEMRKRFFPSVKTAESRLLSRVNMIHRHTSVSGRSPALVEFSMNSRFHPFKATIEQHRHQAQGQTNRRQPYDAKFDGLQDSGRLLDVGLVAIESHDPKRNC